MSESRAVANEHEGHKRTLPIISSSFWMTVGVKGLYNAIFYSLYNPLTPIGSPVTHENWPMNWPNFAASPALLGWPARNRHTAACIHRFSHILRWPPEPVVWFMSESRAVANEHEGHKRTLPIISSSFWMTVGVKGLTKLFHACAGADPGFRWGYKTRSLWMEMPMEINPVLRKGCNYPYCLLIPPMFLLLKNNLAWWFKINSNRA